MIGSSRKPSFVLGVLLSAYILSFVDRQVIGLLADPIKRDLDLSDIRFSLISGFSFALFYAAMGLLMGRASDRWNRRGLILLGMAIWVPATAMAGFANGFVMLVLSRVLLAVGEAMLAPAAYSMIGDCVPPSGLSRAMGVYSMGVNIGSGLAFLIGGAVMASVAGATEVDAGLLGMMKPWQLTFLVVAAPGVLVFALMLLIEEPERREILALPGITTGEAFSTFFRRHAAVFFPLILGFAAFAIVTYGYILWVPATFMRTWGWTAGEVGSVYGTIILLCGVGGMLLSGSLADLLFARRRRHGALIVALVAGVGLLLSNAAFALAPNAALAWACVGATTFLLGAPIALAPSILLPITPNRMRGQIVALGSVAITLVGLGAGPTLIAAVTNELLADESRIQAALGWVACSATGVGCLLLLAALRPYRVIVGSDNR